MRIILSTSSKSVTLYYMADRKAKARKVSVPKPLMQWAVCMAVYGGAFALGYGLVGPALAMF